MENKTSRRKNEPSNGEEAVIASELAELGPFLDHYAVKYPDDHTINEAVEQLRGYVPGKKRPKNLLLYRVFPSYRVAGAFLLLTGCLMMPDKII